MNAPAAVGGCGARGSGWPRHPSTSWRQQPVVTTAAGAPAKPRAPRALLLLQDPPETAPETCSSRPRTGSFPTPGGALTGGATAGHGHGPPLGDSKQRVRLPEEVRARRPLAARSPPCEQRCCLRRGSGGPGSTAVPSAACLREGLLPPRLTPSPTQLRKATSPRRRPRVSLPSSASSPTQRIPQRSQQPALLGATRWPALTRLPEAPSPPGAPLPTASEATPWIKGSETPYFVDWEQIHLTAAPWRPPTQNQET